MTSVVEIKKAEDELNDALSNVRSQLPIDKTLETNFQNTDNSYRQEIAPLQENFDETLKQYMTLMNQYWDQYVDLTNKQNAARKASWDEQMQKYNNYNYASIDEQRDNALQAQSDWKQQQQALNIQYENALSAYNTSLASWENTQNQRSQLIATIQQNLNSSKQKRLKYETTHSSDYTQQTVALYNKIKQDFTQQAPNFTSTTLKDTIGWFNSYGTGDTKQAHVVDWSNTRNGIWGLTGSSQDLAITDLPPTGDIPYCMNTDTNGDPNSWFLAKTTPTLGWVQGETCYATNNTGGGLTPWGKRPCIGGPYLSGCLASCKENGVNCATGPETFNTGVTKYNIWGSAFKVSKIWGEQLVAMDNDSFTIDNVPKTIWYPHGPWENGTTPNPQEDWGVETKYNYFTFMKVFYLNAQQLIDCNGNAYCVGQFDDWAAVYINGQLWYNGIERGWGGGLGAKIRSGYETGSLNNILQQGPNIIQVVATNFGGPAGFALVFGAMGSNGEPDYTNIFTTTNESWIVIRGTVTDNGLNTAHEGVSVNDSDIYDINNALTQAGYFKKITGAQGVQTHNYSPPDAKVQYVRVSWGGQRPTTGSYIAISQLAVYPVDDMNTNVAEGQSVNAYSVYQNGDSQPSYAVDGTLEPRAYPYIYMSDDTGGWSNQYFEIILPEPVEIYKIDFFGRSDCCQDSANGLCIQLYDENNNVVFEGPPFGSDATTQSFYFNNPIVPPDTQPKPTPPVKGQIGPEPTIPKMSYNPPAYPVMQPFITPNQQLLNKIIGLSDKLITLNLKIQAVYKKYSMDPTITSYQSSVLKRRKELVSQVLEMINERDKLTESVNDYIATQKNQIGQERRATSNYTYFWIWGALVVILAILLSFHLFSPESLNMTPNVIAWTIIILVTLITTAHIGGSITFMLWLVIIVHIIFYLVKKHYYS